MINKDIMIEFINLINDNRMLTDFIKDIFNYKCLYEHNYIFRMINNDNQVIIDIYDNVSENRFNRYIFDFIGNNYDVLIYKEDDLLIKKISIINSNENGDNILKLGYLFKLNMDLMIDFGYKFLDSKFVLLLEDIIKR